MRHVSPLTSPSADWFHAELRNCQISAGQEFADTWLSRYEAWYCGCVEISLD